MRIWVDADACPNVIKETLFRAVARTQTPIVFVANQYLQVPRSQWITFVKVPPGFDVADNHIAQNVNPEDLVVTADIPLAADVVAKGALALNPRGELYTENNIRARLALRNMMEEMRSAGQISGGPPTLSQTERREFANQLDRWLAKGS